MAQKVQVLLVDDLNGGTADETVNFGLDGVTYEIDLTAENASQLREALGTWVGSARKISGKSRGAARGRRSGNAVDAQAVRDWAKANGHAVSERGRISAEVKAAYDAAH